MSTGFGVLINALGGNKDSAKAVSESLHKEITGIKIDEDFDDGALILDFDIGASLRIYDNGRSCCESRYMTCDDPLEYFVGSLLFNVEIRDGSYNEDDYDFHEMEFLVVTTSKGSFTVETHNHHNGYYGGFWIKAELLGENDLGDLGE